MKSLEPSQLAQMTHKFWREYCKEVHATKTLAKTDVWLSVNLKKASLSRTSSQFIREDFLSMIRAIPLAHFLHWRKSKELPFQIAPSEWTQYKADHPSIDVSTIARFSVDVLWLCGVLRFSEKKDVAKLHKESKYWQKALNGVKHAGAAFLEAQLLWNGLPLTLLEAVQKRKENSGWTSEELEAFLGQFSQKAQLWLRWNRTEEEFKKQALAEFEETGLAYTEHSGSSFLLKGKKGIMELESWKSGLFEIQDLASQTVIQELPLRQGQFVWDTCAGYGGKTMAIAAKMNGHGSILATDCFEEKLAQLKKRFFRTSWSNLRTSPWDGTQNELSITQSPEFIKKQGFDVIVVDVPCSASGTWRRDPDALWRHNLANTELNKLQLSILENASLHLRKNGTLAYITCSWISSENEDVVSAFLENHPEFSLKKQKIVGSPQMDADALFLAILEKN